jgi:ABC-type glycerol-3-phosphate transport system substrate-binding protein
MILWRRMEMNKRLIASILAVACISSFVGCSQKASNSSSSSSAESSSSSAETTTASSSEEEARDLGGMEIIVGDWWSSGEESAPQNAKDEATQEYRKEIQEKYNFKIKQVAISDWGGMQELFTTSVMAGDPKASVFILAPSWIAQPIANDLAYDLATIKSLDFSQSKWNKLVTELTTKGKSIYGMAAGKPEPRLGLFWNKRLFKEAGLDENLPYDLQKSGDWTWSKFEELCQKLTRDTNNDGKMDTYAMVNFSPELFSGAIFSNNAEFITKGSDGKYANGTKSPEFLEALQWAVSLIQKGYEMPTPQDANWDWFVSAFHDAKAAMIASEEYRVGTWKDMKDDFGFVLFPKGPKAKDYRTYFSDNVAVIPSCFDAETADKIAFAYNLYTNPTPGYEDEDSWKDSYYSLFRDERAVDETLALMYKDGVGCVNYINMIPNISIGDIAWDVYALVSTPAEKIEAISGTWQAAIDEANK